MYKETRNGSHRMSPVTSMTYVKKKTMKGIYYTAYAKKKEKQLQTNKLLVICSIYPEIKVRSGMAHHLPVLCFGCFIFPQRLLNYVRYVNLFCQM